MPRIFVAFGSNLGDRAAHICAGVAGCVNHGLRLTALSPLYETSPVGGPAGQADYLNAVGVFESGLSPMVVLRILQRVEDGLLRKREIKNGPRTIDLDLLAWGDTVMATDFLTLPHPRIAERLFVLRPFCDVAPDFKIPGTGMTVRELYENRVGLEPPSAVAPHRADADGAGAQRRPRRK